MSYSTRLLCPWGFSRQEYWSGLHAFLQGNLPNPGLPHCRQILYHLSHQGSPRILEWVAYRFSRGSSQPRSPTLQVDSLPTERRGKPTNTGGGNLSLLQGIFLTQELNWGVLHCRWILYQLSYEGSPLLGNDTWNIEILYNGAFLYTYDISNKQ